MAGQLVSIYALGSLLAAIPLTVLTSGWRRKKVLLLAVGTFLIFNTITTLSSSYWLTMAARFMSGVAAGLAWGILAGYGAAWFRLNCRAALWRLRWSGYRLLCRWEPRQVHGWVA
jgi:predicted MFS family arabinose efflux permease